MSPQISESAIPGEELGRVRPSFAGAWQLDVVGHARGHRGLAPQPDRKAWTSPYLLRPGDRDRTPAALGFRSAVATNRRPVALDCPAARGEPGDSRPHHLFPTKQR